MKLPVQITLFESEKHSNRIDIGSTFEFTDGMTALQLKDSAKSKIEELRKITVGGPVKLFLNRKELQDADVLEFMDGNAYNCKIYKA